MPPDTYHLVLRNTIEAYLEHGLEAGRRALAPIAGEIWPGLPPSEGPSQPRRPRQGPRGKRSFSAARSAATLERDHFRCRYCGCEIIPKPIAVLTSTLYPEELPFHPAYRGGCMHPLYWTRVAEADHLVPGSDGGAWEDPTNHVTACVVCNTRKGDLTLQELGWTLKEPKPGWDGITGLYRRLWLGAGQPSNMQHHVWLKQFGR